MKGWSVPATIRAAMAEPIDARTTPLAVLEALRDDVAARATVCPDAELARQALEGMIELRRGADPGPAPDRHDAPTAGVVVDDEDDCLGCQ